MKADAKSRFLSHVNKSELTECWNWTASLTNGGYGRFKYKGKTVLAHRWGYKYFVGDIPSGLTLDHLCRNRKCVNPDHLEAVTMKENVLRGNTITAENHRKTHCIHGHPLNGNNLFVRRDGRRRCKTCEQKSQKHLRSTPLARQRHAECERERKRKQKLASQES